MVSKTQAGAIRAAVAHALASDMSAEATAQAAIAITGIKWHLRAHCEFAVGPLEATTVLARKRRNVQDWLAIPTYFTEHVWSFLGSRDNPSPSKLDLILTFAFRGGLRLPSEATSKLMTSTWLITSEPHLDTLSTDQKMVYLQHAKKAFLSMRKRAADPIHWVETLPASPFTFQASYPTAWATWYANGETPSLMPAGFLAKLQSFDSTYGCRSTKVTAPTLSASPVTTLEKILNTLLQNQNKVFDIALEQAHGRVACSG